jgi:hypothetical protein
MTTATALPGPSEYIAFNPAFRADPLGSFGQAWKTYGDLIRFKGIPGMDVYFVFHPAAAKSRFHRYGIQKTTMQEIARDAGLFVGTLYLYFKNKDEILLACTQAFREEHERSAALILQSEDAADEKLRAYICDRFRAAKATREGTDHAAEIARAVIRNLREFGNPASSDLGVKATRAVLTAYPFRGGGYGCPPMGCGCPELREE